MMVLPEEEGRSREFICPCGKAYFSYAALFTHVKQKHQGKPPGPLIKPKPENKRGRPRKLLVPAPPARRSPPSPARSNPPTSDIKLITPLPSTPGSQFKHYQADPAQLPTQPHLPHLPQEHSLLQDFVSHLALAPLPVPPAALAQLQAAQLLLEPEGSQLLESLAGFVRACREELREEAASQVELLVAVLGQHVWEERGRAGLAGVSLIQLNDHIESFFGALPRLVERWGLGEWGIFEGLTPMKILVVLYNWLNSEYSHDCSSQDSQ